MQTEAWVFYEPNSAKSVREEIRNFCTKRGWGFQSRPTAPAMYSGRRRMYVTAQKDAFDVYARCHRARVAILSQQTPSAPGVLVCKQPDAQLALLSERVVSLRHYGYYKAFFRRLMDPSRPLAWTGQFLRWCSEVQCEDIHDPRCLPFHVFEAREGRERRLNTEADRAAFYVAHGGRANLADAQKHPWKHGPNHGVEALHVAGRALPEGFHWDVEAEGGKFFLQTPTETWEVAQYINVAPDANCRSRDRKYARRLIPPKK